MARLTYLTPLVVGVLALAGCPGDDSPPQETDSEGDSSSGTTMSPTTTPTTMTMTGADSTSTGEPETSDSTTTDEPPACDPECAADECCVEGICFDAPSPTCDPPCDPALGETCEFVEGTDVCGAEPETFCSGLCAGGWADGNYDQCINDAGEPDTMLCPEGHTCISGPGNETACSLGGCEEGNACSCPEPPDLTPGSAPAVCSDVTGDGTPECSLSCENDEPCPAGMSCFGGFVCIWPIPQPQAGYKNCSHTAFTCQIGEDCLQDGDMMTPATWAVCSQPGCATEMDCTFAPPSTGDAPVTCGDPTMMGGASTCYLDCSMGQTCPDGMSCTADSWCAWTAGDTVFYDDFQTADFSMGWTVVDVDGQVPADPVSFINDAWIVSDAYDGGAGANLAAYSNSWYSPAGQADDWMISPQIMIGPNARVEWFSRAQDPAYPDGFEVYVSTAGGDVADFTDPAIFTIANEAATGDYVYHQVDLAAAGYADQMIYLAWRNNSNDQFVLLVDDVAVYNLP